MTDLTENSIETLLLTIKDFADKAGKNIGFAPTRVEIGPEVVAHFGNAHAAYDACARLMRSRGYFWNGQVHLRAPMPKDFKLYGSEGL